MIQNHPSEWQSNIRDETEHIQWATTGQWNNMDYLSLRQKTWDDMKPPYK